VEASHGTQAKLLLAFWAMIGFKPGDFMIIGMNEKRAARLLPGSKQSDAPSTADAL
jgi:hypothetical protein